MFGVPAIRPRELRASRYLYIDPAAMYWMASIVPQGKSWSTKIPVPSDTNLKGLHILTQGIVLPLVSPAEFGTTNGWFSTLGR